MMKAIVAGLMVGLASWPAGAYPVDFSGPPLPTSWGTDTVVFALLLAGVVAWMIFGKEPSRVPFALFLAACFAPSILSASGAPPVLITLVTLGLLAGMIRRATS